MATDSTYLIYLVHLKIQNRLSVVAQYYCHRQHDFSPLFQPLYPARARVAVLIVCYLYEWLFTILLPCISEIRNKCYKLHASSVYWRRPQKNMHVILFQLFLFAFVSMMRLIWLLLYFVVDNLGFEESKSYRLCCSLGFP